MKKKLIALFVIVVLLLTAIATAACDSPIPDAGLKKGTYNTTTAVMPSNWNELTYQDNNDTQIMSYLASSFFEYDYEFDEKKGGKYNKDGTINTEAIVEGSYTTNYSAATKLEDVTSKVDAKWGYTEEQKKEGGYAWKITLRKDLKWDDGTAITAADFVYSMQEQLNPLFLNYRANTFYDTLMIKGSYDYFYSTTESVYTTIEANGYESNAAAVEAGADIYIDAYEFYNASGYVDKDGNEISQWVSINDETVYDTADAWAAGAAVDSFSGKELWDYFFAPGVGAYVDYVEVGASYASWLAIKGDNEAYGTTWDKVGMYQDGDYSIVVCMDKSFEFLKEDGSLSYLAAYYMSSLPLVKKSLYEECKVAPSAGSTLWTTTYNTLQENTASWGPYKLSSFQSGKSYKLTKNENWYGYGLNMYANQYNVTTISCECVAETSTQWLKFLAGETDDVALDIDHFNDYKYSKYLTYTPDTGTYGMQLFSDLNTLKKSKNNNGILAIDEFRQAFSLSLNRQDVVEKVWPGTAIPCYGLMNTQYFYDVENGGIYRYTTQAKEGLLRAYGFTKSADGTWSNGAEINGADLEDAYEALTGYNPTKAKELVKQAYTELTTNAEKYGYDATKKITIVYGSSVDNARQRARVEYLQGVLDTLCEGTGLEGKIELVFDASAGSQWADAFRSGATQIGFGYGFSGNPFNPFSIVGGFVDPGDSLNYHTYWNTSAVKLTLTLPAGDYEGAGQTITMGLDNWYFCLNGLAESKGAEYKYNFDAGKVPAEVRLEILAALEEQVITKAYSIMLIGGSNGALLSPKFSQFSDEYNTFMGFGGIRYMNVNYDDAEWAQYVSAHQNDLTSEYKKAE